MGGAARQGQAGSSERRGKRCFARSVICDRGTNVPEQGLAGEAAIPVEPSDDKRLLYAAWECSLHISVHLRWNSVYML